MLSESNGRARVRGVAAAFLCVTGLVTLAVAGVHPAPGPQGGTAAVESAWVPPGMHEAEAGVDVGPGSDEALLVGSPVSD